MSKIIGVIEDKMIGICGWKSGYEEGTDLQHIHITPAVTVNDFNNNKLEGLKFKGKSISKILDYINTFEFASSKISERDQYWLEEIEMGDVFTFDLLINVLEVPVGNEDEDDYCRDKKTEIVYDIDNATYSNIRKYKDNESVDRIIKLALQNANQYRFKYSIPKTREELNELLNKMEEDKLPKITADMYIQWRQACPDNVFIESECDKFFEGNYEFSIEEQHVALFELSALGYLQHAPLPLDMDLPCYFKNLLDKTDYFTNCRKCLY